MIAWILWILSPQIGNISTTGVLSLLLIFKFIAGVASGFLRYSSKNYFLSPIIIAENLLLPQYGYGEDTRHAA